MPTNPDLTLLSKEEQALLTVWEGETVYSTLLSFANALVAERQQVALRTWERDEYIKLCGEGMSKLMESQQQMGGRCVRPCWYCQTQE